MKNNYLEAVSSVFAGACLAASLLTLGVLGRNVLRARRLRWSPLRKKAVAFATLPLLLEMVSLSFWLTNMLLSWTRPCSWFHIPSERGAGMAAAGPAAALLPIGAAGLRASVPAPSTLHLLRASMPCRRVPFAARH